MQNPRHDAQQIGFSDLEQFVARIGLEDVEQRFTRVPSQWDAGAFDNFLNLTSQEGDFRRFRAVSGRSEQAQEAVLAANLAPLVKALDPDVIEVARAVDGRTRVGFGNVK